MVMRPTFIFIYLFLSCLAVFRYLNPPSSSPRLAYSVFLLPASRTQQPLQYNLPSFHPSRLSPFPIKPHYLFLIVFNSCRFLQVLAKSHFIRHLCQPMRSSSCMSKTAFLALQSCSLCS